MKHLKSTEFGKNLFEKLKEGLEAHFDSFPKNSSEILIEDFGDKIIKIFKKRNGKAG